MKANRAEYSLLFDLSDSYGINIESAVIFDLKENDLEIDELSPKCAQFEVFTE